MPVARRLAESLFKVANRKDDDAFVTRMRRARFAFFQRVVQRDLGAGGGPVRVLDIGGQASFWAQVYDLDENPLRLQITIANLSHPDVADPGFEYRTWDALDLREVPDRGFDLCFSNSVIEHLGDLRQQRRGLQEMLRVARYVYLQTPNLYFPVEPHYQAPLVHMLPFPARVAGLALLGGRSRQDQYAIYLRDPINLLSRADLEFLLRDVPHEIEVERVLGLVKSFMVWAHA